MKRHWVEIKGKAGQTGPTRVSLHALVLVASKQSLQLSFHFALTYQRRKTLSLEAQMVGLLLQCDSSIVVLQFIYYVLHIYGSLVPY